MRSSRLLFGFALAGNLACSPVNTPTASSEMRGQVDLKACRLPGHKSEILCGNHFVYEDRAARSGRWIALSVVVLPALTSKPAPDPVFFLAGGPGQGAARIARAGEDALMRALRAERHLVFIDQRGTGDSHNLACAPFGRRDSLQSYFREIFDIEMVRACRRSLEQKADLKLYTTTTAIEDMDEVRGALGYEKINLYAVSYGAVGALEYLRRHPDRVRAAVLAGAVSPPAKAPLHFARGAERAMDKLIGACADDEGCRAAFPHLKDDLRAALDAFAAGPVHFELSSSVKKTKETITLSRGAFVEHLRSMLYNHASARLLPLLIHRAAQGDWLPFAKAAARPSSAPAYVPTLGAYLTVTCSESVAFIVPDEIAEQTPNTFPGDYRIRRHQAACAEWPRGDVPTDFFLPVKAPTPVLLLSGDADPAAPPELGALLLQSMPKGRHIVLKNTPHDYSSDCARRLTLGFIGRPSAENLDASCAVQIRRPGFYTELPARYR